MQCSRNKEKKSNFQLFLAYNFQAWFVCYKYRMYLSGKRKNASIYQNLEELVTTSHVTCTKDSHSR